uniref:Germ cell associated 1 n=1 Tax=Scleropages formosus TaxID=113540 RepID=A0A8C9RRM5_SCLFO
MALLSVVRSPFLTFCQTVLSLLLSTVALLSPYWCEGKQKVPKPLCSPLKKSGCIPVPGLSDSSGGQFSWETGDDRFVFPSFHSGLWTSCEENINLDEWEEKCRSFMDLTPQSEKIMLWLSVTMEMMYMGLLSTSCVLLSLQLCVHAWLPSATRWGLLLNAFSAIFTVLAGLLGMVGHMMFMQVFQVTASMGPEDFKPHSYGYSWAFYVAWAAFSVCMSSGVSTLNNYTKNFLMRNFERKSWSFPEEIVQGSSQLPTASFYCPPPPPIPPPSPPPPPLSPLSPYYSPSCNSTSSNFDHLPPPPPPPLSPYYSPTVRSPSLSLSHSNLSHIPQYSDDGDSL